MMGSTLKQSEAIRLYLALDAAPTGTPTVTIEKQGAAILAATSMTQGLSTLEWYYGYTTGAGATVGQYQVRYTAVIDGVTRYGHDDYEVTINKTDDVKTDTGTTLPAAIDALPTAAEIDTELTGTHDAGSWASAGAGTGAYSVIFNVKDGSANNITGAFVTVHNTGDDDTPLLAWHASTDASGNTATLNIDGAIKVRVKAGNFNYVTSSHTISASGTVNLTGTAATVSNPTDPDVCRLRIYPLTLGNADVANLVIDISTSGKLTKVNDQFITNTSGTFTADTGTVPDSYYFDAVRGAIVHISSKQDTGIDDTITVPDLSTYDVGTDTTIVTRD